MKRGYYVVKRGKGGIRLFLVDRRKNSNEWWNAHGTDAMCFEKYTAACRQRMKLEYGSIEVVDDKEADKLAKSNMARLAELDEKRLGPDGNSLGQWMD